MPPDASEALPSRRPGVPLAPLLIGIGVTVAIFIIVLLVDHYQQQPRGQQLDSYAADIQISGVKVFAAETMMAGSVTYVDGTVRNSGDRSVTALGVTVRFHDSMGQVVQSERNQIVTAKNGPLAPHTSRSFRIGYDHVSTAWNQVPPEIKPVTVFVGSAR
jgi:hypothetical protein